jgi:hypothetical protein
MSTQHREVLKTQPQGKTGYDIRTDILMMAKDLAIKEFDSEFRIYELFHMLENRAVFNESPDKPVFPTIDKVLEIANRMNDFVGKK